MRTAIVADTVFACAVLCNTAHADAKASGLELGARSGYAIPFGQASGAGTNGSSDLDKLISGFVPIWLDAGYRATPNAYLGAFFKYGIGFVSNGTTLNAACAQSGVSCTMNDLMFGIDAHYHFTPGDQIDPYVGLGIGYEILNFNFSQGNQSGSFAANGWQFFNLQLGVDFKAAPNVGIGPFVMFSFDQYSNCSFGGDLSGDCSIAQQAMHQWLTLGVRGVFDVNPERSQGREPGST